MVEWIPWIPTKYPPYPRNATAGDWWSGAGLWLSQCILVTSNKFSASVPVWEMWVFHPGVFHVGKSTIHLSSTTSKSGWSWNRGWNKGSFKANFPVPENGPFCLQRASKHIKTTCHFSKLSGSSGTLAQQFFLVPESLEGKIHRKRSRKPVSLIGKKQPVSCALPTKANLLIHKIHLNHSLHPPFLLNPSLETLKPPLFSPFFSSIPQF